MQHTTLLDRPLHPSMLYLQCLQHFIGIWNQDVDLFDGSDHLVHRSSSDSIYCLIDSQREDHPLQHFKFVDIFRRGCHLHESLVLWRR